MPKGFLYHTNGRSNNSRIGPNTLQTPNTLFHFWLPLFGFWSHFTSKAFRHLKLRQTIFVTPRTIFWKQLSPKCTHKAVRVYLRKTRKFSKKKCPEITSWGVWGLLNTNLAIDVWKCPYTKIQDQRANSNFPQKSTCTFWVSFRLKRTFWEQLFSKNRTLYKNILLEFQVSECFRSEMGPKAKKRGKPKNEKVS